MTLESGFEMAAEAETQRREKNFPETEKTAPWKTESKRQINVSTAREDKPSRQPLFWKCL